MPLLKRCCICGRIADKPYDAMPYRKGFACQTCFEKNVAPAIKDKKERYKRYANNK